MRSWIKRTWSVGVQDWRDDRVSTESLTLLALGFGILGVLASIAKV